MRYYEICPSDAVLTEGEVTDRILNGLRTQIGRQAREKVELVSNTKTAAVVLYRVISDPDYAARAFKLLRRTFREKVRALPKGRYRRTLLAQFPSASTMSTTAFIKALCVVAIMSGVTKARALTVNQVMDQGLDYAVDRLLSLNSALAMLTAGTSLFQLFNVLHVGNEVLFHLLTEIAHTIDVEAAAAVSA